VGDFKEEKNGGAALLQIWIAYFFL
jgi:hypothetical protein